MIEEGTILQDRYQIERQIGQGGMGSVYLATDQRFGSTVAIKETLFADEQFKKAFKREARLLNSLKHSALPKVSDHFIEDNSQYIVMEYIGGKDLFETLETTNEPFSIEEVLKWAHQLLDALEYLHGQENPVIHRDIKPQNLKITSHGQIVLLDFGLAKGNPTDANHQTNANSIFGYSRNYASLEQIQGTGTDPRSDLYSLAATLYHLVTGKPPADALTRVMMVLNEEKDPLQPAAELHQQVTDVLSDCLLSAMSLNANQRPQSAAEMRSILSGEVTAVIPRRDTLADNPLETNFFSRDTKVKPVGAEVSKVAKTERKTEVLPVVSGKNRSVETKVANPKTRSDRRQPADTGSYAPQPVGGRVGSRNVLFAVLGGVSLIAVVLAGAAFMNPEIFGTGDSNGAIESAVPSPPAPVVETESVSDIPGPSDEVDVEPLDKQTVVKSDTADRKEQEAKTPKKQTAPKDVKEPETKIATSVGKSDVVIKDGKIKTQDVTISDGKIETKDVVINPKEIRVKPPQPRPPITREQFEKLSPAQKRKARIALERWRRVENARRKREGLPPIPRRFPSN